MVYDPAAFAVDEDGLLFNPQVRRLVGGGLSPDVLAVVEAFAAISQAARLGRWAMERWAADYGLSEARLQVLLVLWDKPDGMPLVKLAEILEITPPSLTGLIDHLEDDGLVFRRPDRTDRRSVLATLTDLGRARVATIWPDRLRRQVAVTDGVSTAELVELRHLCLRLASNLERATTRRRKKGTAGDGTGTPPADQMSQS